MTCNFCITEDNFNAITSSQAERLLTVLRKNGFDNIVLGGGEPFIWPGDFLALTRKAKDMGFFVQVGTNGTAMPPDFVHIPTIDRYVLPLESIDPAVHNSMRFHKEKHHQTILELFKQLKAVRKNTTVSTIVTKINCKGLKDLSHFLKKLNEPEKFIHAWHLYMFIPEGRGGAVNAPLLSIPEDLYEQLVAEIKKMDFSFPVYKRKNMYHSKTVEFFWAQDGQIITANSGVYLK